MRRFILLCALLLSVFPALAAERMEMIASTAITASGNSPAFKVSTIRSAILGVDFTAGSGTVADFDLWLDCSDDGGTTWFAFPPKSVTVDSTKVTTWTTDLDIAHVVNTKNSTTAEKYTGLYEFLPCDYVRVRYTHTGGSTPSLTLSVSLVGK
jgi:hypothetical protein